MWKIVYNLLAHLALPVFILYGLTQKKIRKNLPERLFLSTRKAPLKDTLWIHAASVGEAAIAENLIHYMRNHTTVQRFMVTTNTYYTHDMLRSKYGSTISVFPLPLDLSYVIGHFIATSQFSALVIIETEIWPNLIWQADKRDIPVVIVNGRISDRTIAIYRRFSSFIGHVLNHVAHVAAQSDEHRNRFISIGMDPRKVTATGNIKYCKAMKDNGPGTAPKGNVITFGSIKEKELDIILPAITSLKHHSPDTLIYIAPRELHLTSSIDQALSKTFRVVRFSACRECIDEGTDIVLVDTIGDLVSIYGRSTVAFVGGSLAPYGGQNILEPLFFGTPVIFGPHMDNFRDIAGLVLDNKAGVMVHSGDELYRTIITVMADRALQQEMGKAGLGIIQRQQDVMKKTVDIIMNVINRKQG